jgi:hypothetical protein
VFIAQNYKVAVFCAVALPASQSLNLPSTTAVPTIQSHKAALTYILLLHASQSLHLPSTPREAIQAPTTMSSAQPSIPEEQPYSSTPKGQPRSFLALPRELRNLIYPFYAQEAGPLPIRYILEDEEHTRYKCFSYKQQDLTLTYPRTRTPTFTTSPRSSGRIIRARTSVLMPRHS